MIPSPAEDISLLREHLYLENIYKNFLYVLNPSKFTELGGFKSTRDYGLGYFNYDVKLGSNVYSSSFLTRLCYKIFGMFDFFFAVYIILVVYCILNYVKIENVTVIEFIVSKFNVLRKMDKKQYLYSDKTEFLDQQEKGEYDNSRHNINSYDESATLNEINLQSRKDVSNNNLEYNHIKL